MAALVVAPPALDADAATGRVRPCLKKNVEAVKRTAVKGRGVPASRSGGSAGDQYVKLKIVLPKKIDDELAEFIQNWSENHPSSLRREAGME